MTFLILLKTYMTFTKKGCKTAFCTARYCNANKILTLLGSTTAKNSSEAFRVFFSILIVLTSKEGLPHKSRDFINATDGRCSSVIKKLPQNLKLGFYFIQQSLIILSPCMSKRSFLGSHTCRIRLGT